MRRISCCIGIFDVLTVTGGRQIGEALVEGVGFEALNFNVYCSGHDRGVDILKSDGIDHRAQVSVADSRRAC